VKKLVVLTGAGMSAESGIPTFRDAGGLWEGYDVMEVATPEGWSKNPSLVLEFYNQRRKKAIEVKPNRGHEILAELEGKFNMAIITQNVDNLHERAGSSNVIHLHGSLFESRSSIDESMVYPIQGWELKLGEYCELGSQLRPNIVWFGELVHKMEEAVSIAASADVFMIVGTSLQVYPAASLIQYVPSGAQIIIVDIKRPAYLDIGNIHFIEDKASTGLKTALDILGK